MAIVLGPNQYGKAENRLVTVSRNGSVHAIKDLTVSTSLRGDLADTHLTRGQREGARDRHAEEHRLRVRQAGAGRRDRGLRAAARPPLRVVPGGDLGCARPDRRARLGSHRRAGPFVRPRHGREAHHGRDDRRLTRVGRLGRTGSGRAEVNQLGVPRLPQGPVHHVEGGHRPHSRDLGDRALALCRHGRGLGEVVHGDRSLLLRTFADKHSLSLQQTLYAMGAAVLEERPEVAEVRLSMRTSTTSWWT